MTSIVHINSISGSQWIPIYAYLLAAAIPIPSIRFLASVADDKHKFYVHPDCAVPQKLRILARILETDRKVETETGIKK